MTPSPAPIASAPSVQDSSDVPDPTFNPPPPASIAVEGGDPVVGELGSFTWQNAGSDAPWLAGTPIRVGPGEQFTVTMTEPLPIARWTAGVHLFPPTFQQAPPIALGEGRGTPRFPVPPRGDWSLAVSIVFGDDLGDATYYWHVQVD